MAISPKSMHKFNEIPLKISMAFFIKIKQILKFYGNAKTPNIQSILE
jgi:hypothetical protein